MCVPAGRRCCTSQSKLAAAPCRTGAPVTRVIQVPSAKRRSASSLGWENSRAMACCASVRKLMAKRPLRATIASAARGQELVDRIVGQGAADWTTQAEARLLRRLGRGLLRYPVEDDDALDHAPFLAALLEAIAVAAGQQELALRALGIGSALQGVEIAFDDGRPLAPELDQDIADLVDVARPGLEHCKRPLEEALDRPVVGAVAIVRIRPVSAAQSGLVGAIDAATVAIEAVADRLAVEQLGKAPLLRGHVRPPLARGTISASRAATPRPLDITRTGLRSMLWMVSALAAAKRDRCASSSASASRSAGGAPRTPFNRAKPRISR